MAEEKVESALKRAVKNVPTIEKEAKIADLKKILFKKTKEYEALDYIYILDKKEKLVGVLSIKDVFRAEEDEKIERVMKKDVIALKPEDDQEKAAILALKNEIKAIPVISKNKKFLGTITPHQILKILHEEHVEDLLYSIGIRRYRYSLKEIFKAGPKFHIKNRIPWLLLGLLGGIIASQVVVSFELVLKKHLLLAAFIPLITYLADAVGTQTETLFLRRWVFEPKLNFLNYLKKELVVVSVLALILGLLISFYGFFRYQDPYLGLVLAVSFFLAIFLAAVIPLLVAHLGARFKIDPAVFSGPFATILLDIFSILVYFLVASFFLKIG